MPADDATLLRRYADTRAEDAFAELVRRHLEGVYAAALRRVGGDTHLAQDVAQQVFVALARKATALAEHPVLTSWLHTATRHEAANVVRRERRRKVREQAAHAMHSMLSDTEAARDWSRVAPVLDAAIDELGETDRRAVLLRFVDRRPFAEIGATLRLTEDAARMRVDRALEKLRTLLARRGVMSTASALGLVFEAQARVQAPAGLLGSVTGYAIASGAASVGTATVAEALGFMSTLKLTGGLGAALLLIAALGTGAWAVRARHAAESALETEQGRAAALDVTLRTAKNRALSAEKTAADFKRNMETAPATSAAGMATAVATSIEPQPATDRAAAGDTFMARHPAVKMALGDYARARVNFRFGELYRRLALTPAQIERFQALVAQAGMGADGPEGDEITLRWLPETRSAELLRELAEILGPAGVKVYQELDGQDENRSMAVHVAGALWFSETPLTPAQADRLTEVFQQSRKKSPGERYEHTDWAAAIGRAREFLSPPQLAVLEGEQARERADQALNQPMSAAVSAPAK